MNTPNRLRTMAQRVKYLGRVPTNPEAALLRKTALFDAEWYLITYPDIREAKANPFDHYLEYGGFEARNPSRYFDSAWYLRKYPDVLKSKQNPLIHFLTSGHSEGRYPLPADQLSKVENRRAYKNLNVNFELSGELEQQENINLIRDSGLFEEKWYLDTYPDLRDAGVDPVEHYLMIGAAEGRRPGAKFDPDWYLTTNPEASDSTLIPLLHFLRHGKAAGFEAILSTPSARQHIANTVGPIKGPRTNNIYESLPDKNEQLLRDVQLVEASPLFNPKWYLKMNPSVAKTGVSAALHYVRFGGFNGKNPSINFDSEYYLKNLPHLRKDGINPLVHYIMEGQFHNKKPLAILHFEQHILNKDLYASNILNFVDIDSWEIENNQVHLFLDKHHLGFAALDVNLTKNSAAYALKDFANTIKAFYNLSEIKFENVRFNFIKNGKLSKGRFEKICDIAEIRTLTGPDTPGSPIILDGWLESDYDLRLKLNVGQPPSNDTGSKYFARLYQFHPSDESELNLVGKTPILPEGICFVDAELVNPHMPILVVFTTESGHLVNAMLLPFPALLRGGLSHGELSYNPTVMQSWEQFKVYSDTLLHEWVGTAESHPLKLGKITIDFPQMTGAERLVTPSYLSWLSHAMKMACEFLPAAVVFDEDAENYLRSSVIPGNLTDTLKTEIKDRQDKSNFELIITADAIPTLAILTTRRLNCPPEQSIGSFISCDGQSGVARCTVSLPQSAADLGRVTPINARFGYPSLRPNGDFKSADGEAKLISLPITLQFQSSIQAGAVSLAFPRAATAQDLLLQPLSNAEKTQVDISVIVNYRSTDDLAAFALSLKTQTLGSKIRDVYFVKKSASSKNTDVEKAMDVLFDNRSNLNGLLAINQAFQKVASGEKSRYVLVCDASVVMTDQRTLEVLYRMALLENVATSSCVILREDGKANTTTFASGGYFPSDMSLSGAGGFSFREVECLSALPDTTYPVVANTFRLTLIDANVWQQLGGADIATFPGPFQDLDFCLRAIKAGYRHLCTSTVRGVSTNVSMKNSVVDAVAERFLPIVQWQDILKSCTLIREVS